MKKIKTLKNLKKSLSLLKKKGKKVVFTNGCFDILHYGHLVYLEKCKRLGDILVVGLNSDKSVKSLKGKYRPIKKQKERAAILSALWFVDYVIIFSENTPKRLIESITPDILAKGGDWKKKDIVGGDHVVKSGGKVATVPFVKGYSTTRIIGKIKE